VGGLEAGQAGVEPPQDRREAAGLDQVVAAAARGGRAGVLGRFRVGEDVGAVGALVHRRHPDLGEPDRLSPRHPGRRAGLETAVPLDVRVRPPAHEVLGPEDPGLGEAPVGDRGADLRRPVGLAGIGPVEGLAGPEPALEVGRVVDRIGERQVGMGVPVAPVGQGRVVVDPHRVDGRVREQRVEGEADRGTAVAHVGAVFRPVGGVDELDVRAEALAQGRRQAAEALHGGVAARLRPHPGEADELAAEDEAGERIPRRGPGGRQGRVMQHERTILREEGRHLRAGRGAAVRARRLPGGGVAGDAPAPGIGRLAGTSIITKG
jgi:hypothetical protein